MLSKSSIIRGLQCEKSLYLNYYYPYLRDKISEEQKQRFSIGKDIGKLAQKLFPGGVEIPFNGKNKPEAIRKTRKLIAPGNTIYESCFEFNDIFIACDILTIHPDNSVSVYEVKSSTKITPVYLQDIAIQYYILKHLGFQIKSLNIVHINNQYVLKGDLNIKELFQVKNVYDDALKILPEIERKIPHLKEIIKKHELPQIPIGTHCFQPYPCDFQNQCWKKHQEHSVFQLKGVQKETIFKLYEAGIENLEDIPPEHKFPLLTKLQIQSQKENVPHYIDKKHLRSFLSAIQYPISFLDFETFQSPVPIFQGTRPYEQIPFQFSLHILNKSGKLQHHAFIGEWGTDFRKAFIETLLKKLPEKGSVVAYNAKFEKTILLQLADVFPEYKEKITAVIQRIIDLLIPFKKGYYYLNEMQGSASLKYVLPAIFPKMSYDSLDISNGLEASRAFLALREKNDMFEAPEIKKQLEEYCAQDTLALVKIYRHLKNLAED